jgi:uncharacterized protein YjdB
MKRIYFILSFCFLYLSSNAQTAATYGFTALSAPFSSIALTGTLIPTLSDDDVTELAIPIGFNFDYCGTTYTSLSACSNGWLSLNNSPSLDFDNIELLIDGPGWIMPYWDDLDGFFTGAVFCATTGIAPNRVFTIEWNNYESLVGFGSVTFQVKLYETTNIIDFHYGLSTLFGSDATMGISNDNISDWQTLSDESAAPTALLAPLFINTIVGTPADGQIYRWTPSSCVVSTIAGTLTTCPGATTTLTNATAGGTWSSSTPAVGTVGSTSGVVSGLSAGTTTITYTASPGCFATAVVTVSAITPVTGTYTVCTGSTTTLGHVTAGGTWSSSAPAIATINATTGEVAGLTPGTATMAYTLPGGCVANAVVTVYATPAAITGTLLLCQGNTNTLASTTLGGAWSSSLTGVATIDAGLGNITGIAGGTTTISYTMPSGCYSLAIATVNPTPGVITGGTSTCLAGTLALSSTTFGGTWSSTTPATATINASTGVLTGIGSGTTTVSYTLASGCFTTLVVSVTSVVAPITGDIQVCRFDNSLLGCTTPGGTWSSSAPAIGTIGAATGLFQALSAGTTTISYTLGSGCFTTAIVTVDPVELIGGIATVCPGSTITMTNAVAGGTWASANTAVFTVNAGGVVTGISAGTVNISYTNPFGCSIATPITVNPLPTAIAGDLLICVGTTSTLSSGPAGGVWSHTPLGAVSIDGVTGIVTGVSVGVSEVTYTNPATTCMVRAAVTVDPAPAAITGGMSVCPGNTSALGHPVSGGTWASSNAAVASISATGVLTGVALAGGTATISYTLPTSGCVATRVATVLPAPAAIGGALTVCVGATTALTSAGAAWSSSNTAVATVGAGTGTVGGISAGTATIIATGANTCTRSAVVTVNANPGAITGTAIFCAQSTTTLAAAPAGGAWSSSNLPVATVNGGGIVAGINNGTATISYTLLGCSSTRIVTVQPLPAIFTPAAPTTVCLGLTTTLNSTPGGTWSSSNIPVADIGSTTGVVTGNATGTAVITYTLPSGCLRTRTITVNPLPAAIGGATSICPGSTVTLTNTSPGGTWSSSNTAVATIVTGSGAVTGVAGGTSTITYTVGTGCISTAVMSVISAPIAAITAIGDTNLCPGDFVTLTSSAAIGATYEWYDGGVLIPTATTPTYITSAAGSYQVRVSISAGCTTLSVPKTVSVFPATASITVPGGVTTTCAGSPVALDANTGVGLTYQWQLGGAPITGATAATYNAAISGNYTVRVTNAQGCWAVSAPVSITVNPTPSNVVTASGPLTFCNGGSVTLSAVAGFTYQWYNSVGAIAGATAASFTTSTPEDYYVEVTGAGACIGTSAISTVIVNPLPDVSITPGGTRVFCAGGNVQLDAAAGYGYQWYRNGTALAGATNATYFAFASGGYRVEVTDLATGCTDMTHADTVVTVISSPTSLPLTPSTFCWGGSSLLSTSVSGLGSALTYQWFFNGVAIPGAVAANYTAGVSGNYHCRIAVPGSCTILTNTVPVTEMPLPDPPITFNGTIFQTGSYYVSYQWYKNLVAIPGAVANTTPATSDGNYKVAVTDTNGCQSVSSVYVLTGWKGGSPGTGVTNVNTTDISIFPNPAAETIYIACEMKVRAVVSSIDGKVLITAENAKEISLKGLADGVYIVSLYDENGQQLKVQKLVKRQ